MAAKIYRLISGIMKTNTSIDFCVLPGLKAALQQSGFGIQYLHIKEHICTYAYVTVFMI